jgi:hypothetical protein
MFKNVDWWPAIAAFLLGIMIGPIAHAVMDFLVKLLGERPW